MKKLVKQIAITIALLLPILVLPGCFAQRTQQIIDAFRGINPTVGVLPVDEDKDGLPETYGIDADGDGQVDEDEDGKPIEIPGVRAQFNAAKTADMDLSEIFTILGTIVGVPGIGLIGSYIGRRKPIQRLNTMQAGLATVVKSFDEARVDSDASDILKFSKETLKEIQGEMPWLVELLAALRAKPKS